MSQTQKIKDRSRRAMEVLKWRVENLFAPAAKTSPSPTLDSQVTFLIAHFNSPEFLAVCLHAVRKVHPESAIVVADATSDWVSYQAAKKECERYKALMRPVLIQHRHSGILNLMFREVKTEFAVFLDQDCVLLHRLDGLLQKVQDGILLAGPRDKMLVDYALRSGARPDLKPKYLRDFPNYVHASLMVMQPRKIRELYGDSPFVWQKEFGDHLHEKYHGLSHQLHASRPQSMLLLNSLNTPYGLGMVYFHEGTPIAYHQWYSGRVHKQEGRIDGLPVERLKDSIDRFLTDYWKDQLDFDLTRKVS